MQISSRIIKFWVLNILACLVLLPCSIKQQLKGDFELFSDISYEKQNAKSVCNLVHSNNIVNSIECQKIQIKDFKRFKLVNYLIFSDLNLKISSKFHFFFKEKIPSYLLFCVFII